MTFGSHQFQRTHVLLYKSLGLGYETKTPATNEMAASALWQVYDGQVRKILLYLAVDYVFYLPSRVCSKVLLALLQFLVL